MNKIEPLDYTMVKNETAAANQSRKDLTELLLKAIEEIFGEENSGQVDKGTIGFVFGRAKDKDGFLCDMAANIKIIIKPYQDHEGTRRFTPAYDFFKAKEFYAENGYAYDPKEGYD